MAQGLTVTFVIDITYWHAIRTTDRVSERNSVSIWVRRLVLSFRVFLISIILKHFLSLTLQFLTGFLPVWASPGHWLSPKSHAD